ncbi:hypothetical protein BaRGS_00011202, partial [Batillaria attramentaria]
KPYIIVHSYRNNAVSATGYVSPGAIVRNSTAATGSNSDCLKRDEGTSRGGECVTWHLRSIPEDVFTLNLLRFRLTNSRTAPGIRIAFFTRKRLSNSDDHCQIKRMSVIINKHTQPPKGLVSDATPVTLVWRA